jgi:hypothetical protein
MTLAPLVSAIRIRTVPLGGVRFFSTTFVRSPDTPLLHLRDRQ